MGEVEDFLKDPFHTNIGLTPPAVSPSGIKRKFGVAVRGATLGLTGTQPETLSESLIEMGSSLVPIAGISAIAGPAVGTAARAAGVELAPTAARIAAGGLTGAATGAISEQTLKGTLETGALFAGAETGIIGASKVLSKIRGRKPSVLPVEPPKPEPKLPQTTPIKDEIESVAKIQPDLPQQAEFEFKTEPQQTFKFESPYGPKISAEAKSLSISDMAKARTLLEGEEGKTLEQIQQDRKQAADLLRGSSRDRITLRDISVDEAGRRLSIAPKDVPIHFQVGRSAETGRLLFKPLTLEADQALKDLSIAEPARQLPLQLSPEQLNFINGIGRGIKNFLDIVTKQEALSGPEIGKMSEIAAEVAVDNSIPMMEVIGLNKTVAAQMVDLLAMRAVADSGINPKTMVEEVIREVDSRLGISGLTGGQMQEQINLLYKQADDLGLVEAQRTAWVQRQMVVSGLKKGGITEEASKLVRAFDAKQSTGKTQKDIVRIAKDNGIGNPEGLSLDEIVKFLKVGDQPKTKTGPRRDAIRRQMILDELKKRCLPSGGGVGGL